MLRRACETIHLAMAQEKRPLESRISQSPQKPSPESKAPCQKKINYRNRVAWPGALEFGHVLLQRSPFLPPTSRVKGKRLLAAEHTAKDVLPSRRPMRTLLPVC